MTKILLVEDSEQIWDFLSRRLIKKGFDVVLAHDGESGVETGHSQRPDIILMDMNLPIMDGWTATRALKSDDRTRNIPVIALTAHAMAGDQEKTAQAGCDGYHPKPIDFPLLLDQISKFLEPAKQPD